MTPTEKVLKESVDIDRLLTKLDFSDEAIVPAAVEQPGLMKESSRYVAKKRRQLAEAETALEIMKSELALKIRNQHKQDKKPPTEGNIKEILMTNAEYIAAVKRVDNATVEYEFSKGLRDAFQHRMSCLKIVANMNTSEAMLGIGLEKDKAKLEKLKKNIKNNYPDSDEEEL